MQHFETYFKFYSVLTYSLNKYIKNGRTLRREKKDFIFLAAFTAWTLKAVFHGKMSWICTSFLTSKPVCANLAESWLGESAVCQESFLLPSSGWLWSFHLVCPVPRKVCQNSCTCMSRYSSITLLESEKSSQVKCFLSCSYQ